MTHSTRGGALTVTSAATGFHSRTTLDESPETQRKIRLAVARAKEGDQEALRFLYVTYSTTSTATCARSSATITRPRT